MIMPSNVTSPPIINLRDVHVMVNGPAGAVNILKGLSLQAHRGEVVAIVGPSGAGKSTLLMVLAGLEAISAGSVHVAGVDLTALDEDALALFRRRHVGVVFQSFHLITTMTALENVAIPLELAGRKNSLHHAADTLSAVGLGDRLHHYPGQLSGGEQQRVAIARAFAAEPDLILADEPTGSLDSATGVAVMDLLFSLTRRTKGTTLALVTHDLALAARCDRVMKLVDGVLEDGDTRPH